MRLTSTMCRSVLVALLLTSLLSQPIFCAPEAPRHFAFAVANGAEDVWEDITRRKMFSAIVNLPSTVLGFITDSKRRKVAPRISRIRLTPDRASLRFGERTNFAAIAMNGENSVGGVNFNGR